MKIIDCFMFGLQYELDILELRLEYLDPIVDYFVIVEAMFDHQHGKSKELYFNINKDRFKKYLHKIKHIVVESPLTTVHTDCIKGSNENFHRNQIIRGINETELCSDDVIILSDIDEFPSINSIKYYVDNKLTQPHALAQDMYYYFLNMKAPYTWNGSILSKGEYYLNSGKPQDLRDKRTELKVIPVQGGWHFSYMGGSAAVKQKIDSIYDGREYENNKDEFSIEEHIERCFLHLPNRAALYKVNLDEIAYPQNIISRYDQLLSQGLMK